MVKVLDDAFGVEQGLMTTVHAYTGDQASWMGRTPTCAGAGRCDQHHPDLNRRGAGDRARAAVDAGQARWNLAPGSGSHRLHHRLHRGRERRAVGRRRQRRVLRRRSSGRLAPVLDYTEEPIVSSDIVTSPASCTLDAGMTMTQGSLVKVVRLVRQRVGLLQPPRRPRSAGRGGKQPMIEGVPELEDLGDVSGKSVLVRADFNVPLDGDRITDDLRIRAALPTLKWLEGCRREGERLLPSRTTEGPTGSGVLVGSGPGPPRRARPGGRAARQPPLQPGEESNDPGYVPRLVAGHDVYVNDAFGASHRSHASIVGPPETLPSAAGRLLAKEVEVLLGLRRQPRHPFVAIMGGAKVSDKLGVIESLLGIVDSIVVGGGMALHVPCSPGSSGRFLTPRGRHDRDVSTSARFGRGHPPSEDSTALGPGGKLFDPAAGGEVRQVGRSVPEGWMGVDIGPGTAAVFTDVILDAGTVLWNGPLGVFEDERFAAGTRAVAEAIAETRAYTVVGGGDSAAAAKLFGVDGDVDHMSTGGGASLELIEQGDLPGLEALRLAGKRMT